MNVYFLCVNRENENPRGTFRELTTVLKLGMLIGGNTISKGVSTFLALKKVAETQQGL